MDANERRRRIATRIAAAVVAAVVAVAGSTSGLRAHAAKLHQLSDAPGSSVLGTWRAGGMTITLRPNGIYTASDLTAAWQCGARSRSRTWQAGTEAMA